MLSRPCRLPHDKGLLQLLFGEPPFFSKDDKAQVRLIQKHDLKFPPKVFDLVSAPSKGFIRLLLAPEPQMRMGIAEALRHPCASRLEGASPRFPQGFRGQPLEALPRFLGHPPKIAEAPRESRAATAI